MDLGALANAAAATERVSGFTHEFYRYPARFSPRFARSAIESLTNPGETVLDPFMGGATSGVEALACGRKFIGCDINPLSTFLARAKTTPLTEKDIAEVEQWAHGLGEESDLRPRVAPDYEWNDYQRNLPWWIRNVIELALSRALWFDSDRARQFARCALMKTGQWALDCRMNVPSAREFIEQLKINSARMTNGMREFQGRLSAQGIRPSEIARSRRFVLGDSTTALGTKRIPSSWLPPKLILTSPPYLGVHILYHRWQVRGRRESPAPFWIANSLDGFGASHYTFGDRRCKETTPYITKLKSCFSSIVEVMGDESLLVQLVAFSKPQTQLAPYLRALNTLGLSEIRPSTSRRMWRDVPNRKWYAELRGAISSSREVVLVHRRA